MPASRLRFAAVLLLHAGAGCASDHVTRPGAACNPDGADLRRLAPFEARVVQGAELGCIRLNAGADYLVVPQILGDSLPHVYHSFLLGDPFTDVDSALSLGAMRADGQDRTTATDQLHFLLRSVEIARSPAAVSRQALSAGSGLASDPEPTREFSVLATLRQPLRFDRVAARLRYAGDHVLLYVDERAANAYADAELQTRGALLDDILYPITREWFGAPSDIDGNGRVIILLTPSVNALVAASECGSFGFATGFFFGFDLADTSVNSNRGEIFYALVPDAAGEYSCPHTRADVDEVLPATFAHELQHMISYGVRVVNGGGAPQALWLNEALSHAAEELVSLHYEQRYPPPSGRTDPLQLFPDSAGPFMLGNALNSHRFLRFSAQYSAAACAPAGFCSTGERGGSWLLLRWLSDVSGVPSLFRDLVAAPAGDRAGIERVTGRAFASLFGEFALALWADSIAGQPRQAAGPRLRFTTRNLRRLYSALYDAYGPLGGIPARFPITPQALSVAGRVRTAVRPGGLQFFVLQRSSDRDEAALSLTGDAGELLHAGLAAQLSILRLP